MKKGKKKFIDKKSATTFVVLSRGGPGAADGASATDKVFVPRRPHNLPRGQAWQPGVTLDESGEERSEEADFLEGGRAGEVGVQVGNYRADDFSLGEYGFPDDGYDYSQHFAPMGGGQFFAASALGAVTAANRQGKGEAQPSVLVPTAAPKNEENDFLNGAPAANGQFSDAESEELEVLKALEDSEEDEELEKQGWVLQDDFVAAAVSADTAAAQEKKAANAAQKKQAVSDRVRFADADFDDDEDEDESYVDGEDDYDDDDDDDEDNGADEEFRGGGGPRGVIQFEERTGGGVLDGYLDHMLEREYNDEQLGEGPEELLYADNELRGKVFANDLGSFLDDYLEDRKLRAKDAYRAGDEIDEEQRQRTIELAKKALANEDNDVEIVEQVVEDQQWDCESILSTYSNIANHPQMINDERSGRNNGQKPKKKTPVQFADQVEDDQHSAKADDKSNGEDEDDSDDEPVNKGKARAKNETPEEKKARKAAVKEERRRAREAKKQLKSAYKSEAGAEKKRVEAVPFYGKSRIPM